jgi:hypothetical protein
VGDQPPSARWISRNPLGCRQDDHRVEISLLTTEARALGLLRDFDTARSDLASAREKADSNQLPGLYLEVRLAGVELAFRDARTPPAERTREAEALRTDAEKAGFLRIVSKLDALIAAR